MSPRGFSAMYPRSTSPAPAQPQSKRDKKRTLISDRLTAMKESFDAAHQEHFYAQLSATHCDINLILGANPHRGPLDDFPEEIARLVAEARGVVCSRPISAEAESSFTNLSGKAYTQYVEEVNAAMEQRDVDLTMAFTNYQNGLSDLKKANDYRIRLAHEEHNLLTSTLRERLITSVTAKKARLLKDKEQLDIADSNALLLNPTQFSIGNPASPGGIQNPRKTRNTRGRPGEGDEPAALSAAEANGKRKRKAAFDDDSGSPAPPASRNISDPMTNGGIAAPSYRDAKARAAHSQFEAPLYSVDRLFPEKELTLTLNRAHLATNEYFDRLKARGIESRLHAAVRPNAGAAGGAVNGANGNGDASTHQKTNGEGDANGALHDTTTNEDDAQKDSTTTNDAPPTAHATRSSQRTALPPTNDYPTNANPLDSLATIASASTTLGTLPNTYIPHAASSFPTTFPTAAGGASLFSIYAPNPTTHINLTTTAAASKQNPAAPPPPPASEADVAKDLAMIRAGVGAVGYEALVERGVGVRDEFGRGGNGDGFVVSAERDKERERGGAGAGVGSSDGGESGRTREREAAMTMVLSGSGAGAGVGMGSGLGLGIAGLASVPMSKTSSLGAGNANGHGDRGGNGEGAVGMRRTVSARGGGAS